MVPDSDSLGSFGFDSNNYGDSDDFIYEILKVL